MINQHIIFEQFTKQITQRKNRLNVISVLLKTRRLISDMLMARKHCVYCKHGSKKRISQDKTFVNFYYTSVTITSAKKFRTQMGFFKLKPSLQTFQIRVGSSVTGCKIYSFGSSKVTFDYKCFVIST